MRKIYRLKSMDACKLQTNYCGVKVALEFKDTMIKSKKEATLSTSNPFVQDAIEHDARYGKVIVLMAAYDDSPKQEVVQEVEEERPARRRKESIKRRTQEEIETSQKKMSVNDAIAFFESNGEKVENEDNLAELAEKHGIVIE